MTEPDDRGDIAEALRKQLESCGIEVGKLSLGSGECFDLGSLIGGLEGCGVVKIMCLTGNLRDSVDALGDSARDHVVMVRVDEDTVHDLDAWVEAGAVKSRSAAAALFIREGLKVRDPELQELKDALEDVDRAKQRLREKAETVLGSDGLDAE